MSLGFRGGVGGGVVVEWWCALLINGTVFASMVRWQECSKTEMRDALE